LQKTDTHIYLVMDLCTAGDLALYIRKRGDLPSLEASNQGLLPERSSSRELDPKKVLYPHPKEGGLNETIVRCFLDQLGKSHVPFLIQLMRLSCSFEPFHS
jgi:serine/threonine-protein kinase ULK/ATG1